MQSGIIRLSKKFVLTSQTMHPHLVQLWNWVNENIEEINGRRASKLQWSNLHHSYKTKLTQQATEFGEGTRQQFLRSRFPDDKSVIHAEKSLGIEQSRTEIADFTGEHKSLVLDYYLITERLMLLGTIGERLLLSKIEEANSGVASSVPLQTFSINFSKDYDIVEYARFN